MRNYGNYDLDPTIDLGSDLDIWQGAQVWKEITRQAQQRMVAVDCYPGVNLEEIIAAIRAADPTVNVIDVEERAGLGAGELSSKLADELTDNRVFGVVSHRRIEHFYHRERLDKVRAEIAVTGSGTVVVGWGATLVVPPDTCVVLADLPRWEIQKRQRRGAPNWRADNGDEDQLRKYKRGFFVEWRAADRHKRPLLGRCDYLLDTTEPLAVKLITGETFRAGLSEAASRPFRLVPYFDPGPWGGTWMQEVCGLEPLSDRNYAWCFDCVPEENSLKFGVAGDVIEIPASNLVYAHPEKLLGQRTYARFGAEFPIRFDFLDTMGGGNLSLQVHPTTDYIQRRFGMPYTQDESYYLLDAEPGATVYLGLRENVDREAFIQALKEGEEGKAVPVESFVNVFEAKAHDHFLIPAGTVHCSGAGSMVLEISATPFLFTFKLWDWGRTGLDGKPRPAHVEEGVDNIDWSRDERWAVAEAVNRVTEIEQGEGWLEESTGLHELEFIETRRHCFTHPVRHHTYGTVQVMNLVAGEAAVVESPGDHFAPFEVHYAETFVVPADVGEFTVRGRGQGPWSTIKASVRGTQVAHG